MDVSTRTFNYALGCSYISAELDYLTTYKNCNIGYGTEWTDNRKDAKY